MNEKSVLVFGAVVTLIVLLVACGGDSASTSTYSSNNYSNKKSYSSDNSYSDNDSDYYYSGKGSDWDEQVNDIYNEYGDDVGMSAAEIDYWMQNMEQGLREQGYN